MSQDKNAEKNGLSRRKFIAASGVAVAAASTESALAMEAFQDCPEAPEVPATSSPSETPLSMTKVPMEGQIYDDLRSFIAAAEKRGLVQRFDRVDQDAFEGTAIVYTLIEEYGYYESPIIIFEEVKIDGQWVKGPVLVNHQAHWETETISLGLEPLDDGQQNYRAARAHLKKVLEENGGKYPIIEPNVVEAKDAPCKEIILRGDEVDLEKFAFITSNPADIGRYVNTASTFTSDPDMGVNYGTYRCELKGPRKLGLNSEPNQTGWKMIMAAKERGEKTMPVTLILGQDPITWVLSSTRVPNRFTEKGPIDENAVAGGLRGKAIDVVKSETNDMMIPAHSEMVIEGTIDLINMEPEGPFGETYGYLGAQKAENFVVNVDLVTHRKDPWLINSFTGVTKGFLAAPEAALSVFSFGRMMPELVDIHVVPEAMGWTFISIDKTKPGQGMKVGEMLAKIVPVTKVAVVVDKDVNLLNMAEVIQAVGQRWQPYKATKLFEKLRGMPLDPSMTERPMGSKIVIDATEQFPEEGGPEVYPGHNLRLLKEGAPGAFDLAMKNWGDVLKRPRKY